MSYFIVNINLKFNLLYIRNHLHLTLNKYAHLQVVIHLIKWVTQVYSNKAFEHSAKRPPSQELAMQSRPGHGSECFIGRLSFVDVCITPSMALSVLSMSSMNIQWSPIQILVIWIKSTFQLLLFVIKTGQI